MFPILTINLCETTNDKTRHFVVSHNANKTPPLPCLITLQMSVNLSCCAYAIIRLVCSYKEKPGSVLSSDGNLEVDIMTRLRAGCVRDPSIQGKRKTYFLLQIIKTSAEAHLILIVYWRLFLRRQSHRSANVTTPPSLPPSPRIIPSLRMDGTIYI